MVYKSIKQQVSIILYEKNVVTVSLSPSSTGKYVRAQLVNFDIVKFDNLFGVRI